MKALTLWQPYATLIAIGAKRIETRGWSTAYRGPLAIHAAARNDVVIAGLITQRTVHEALWKAGLLGKLGLPKLPFGVVVAVVDLVDVLPVEAVQPSAVEAKFGNFSPGRFAWMLGNVQPLPEPIPAKGARSLWDWHDRWDPFDRSEY